MKPARTDILPEVTILSDARGPRPDNAVGIGGFWYEPEIWTLNLGAEAKVLYASLCSYLAHGQINRKDLRVTLGDCADEEIAGALEELAHNGLLILEEKATQSGILPGYGIRSVKTLKG